MGVWAWALEVYGRPGVPHATLKLQDAHGQNTSLLLWAVYAEVTDRGLLAEAARAARAWDEAVLVPLREARRALKPPLPPFPDDSREALREQVKRLELDAERLLLETLDCLAGAAPGPEPERGGCRPLDALTAASEAWGSAGPTTALAELATLLE
ncbi:MAG: TIGR02444 family protein [Pseudomonadota bacterium]